MRLWRNGNRTGFRFRRCKACGFDSHGAHRTMTVIAIDTETPLFGPGRMTPRVVCLSYAMRDVDGPIVGLVPGSAAVRDVRDILESGHSIVGHNLAYDLACLCAMGLPWDVVIEAYESDRVYDTSLRQKLADIAAGCYRGFDREGGGPPVKIGYSLADLTSRALGRSLAKGADTWRMRYHELDGVPIDSWPVEARAYAMGDALATLEVYEVQEVEVPPDWLVDQHRQARAALWLHMASVHGLSVDGHALARFRASVEAEQEDLGRTLAAHGLLSAPVRRRSGEVEPPKRIMSAVKARVEAAYRALGADPPTTEKGATSTDRTACEDSGDPVLVAYAEHSRLGSYLSKDIMALSVGLHDGKIHTRFEPILETGRTASTAPNVQNFPRKPGARECIIPRPGSVFVCADYAGAELSTLAQVCVWLFGASTLAETINAGLDPHLRLASEILGVSYDMAKEVKASGIARGGIAPDDVSRARQTAKVANFGLPGGLGPATLVYYAWQSYHVRLTLDQATHLRDLWRETYPEMRLYHEWVDHQIRTEGRLVQAMSGRIRGKVTFTSACNTMFQGLAADMAKDAGWRILREQVVDPFSPLAGTRTVNFIHDEFVLEADPEDGHYLDLCAQGLADCMTGAARTWCPDVRIGVEPYATMRLSKDAGRRVDDAGRLVAWDW